ncbi:MAG: right-handed parallel beta-helix repeat-containing protein [Limnochordia bacterium]
MNLKRNAFAVLLLCLVVLTAGCGGGGGGGNKAPRIKSHAPSSPVVVAPGANQTFSVVAEDPDGDDLDYAWTATAGTLHPSTTNAAVWTAPQTEGTAKVTVSVSDGRGGVTSFAWDITITASPVNPPIITNQQPASSKDSRIEINVNEKQALSIRVSDPQGLPLNIHWACSRGSFEGDPTDNITATWVAPDTTGDAEVTVTVSNGVKTAEHIFYLDVKGTIQWVREDITGSKTWATGNIYIIDERDIAVKGTLAIQPGAIVKLASGRSLFTQDSGCIVAVGTEENPIIFTSWRDDIHGGDTNGDGGYTSPNAGDWGAVYLETKNANRFEWCEFYFGGAGWRGTMLDLGASNNTPVENCTFAFSEGVALHAARANNPSIKGNTFYNNERPLVINVNTSVDDSNTFHNPDDYREANTYQGIFVDADYGSEITKAVQWSEREAAFVLSGWSVTLTSTGTLSITEGVTLKLDLYYLSVDGILKVQGTLAEPVVITSVRDDLYGGQSNGPDSAAPQPGDWKAIDVVSGSATISYCLIRYGGEASDIDGGYAALYDGIESRGTAVSYTTFEFNQRGLDLRSSSSTVSSCEFTNNEYPLKIGANIDTGNDLLIYGNTYNAIYVHPSGYSVTKSQVKWENTAVPYALLSSLSVAPAKAVNFGTGTIVRVWPDQGIYVESGGTLLNWASATFTSFRDNGRGGDVGAGPWATPQPGDWDGIWDGNTDQYLSGYNIHYAANQ